MHPGGCRTLGCTLAGVVLLLEGDDEAPGGELAVEVVQAVEVTEDQVLECTLAGVVHWVAPWRVSCLYLSVKPLREAQLARSPHSPPMTVRGSPPGPEDQREGVNHSGPSTLALKC